MQIIIQVNFLKVLCHFRNFYVKCVSMSSSKMYFEQFGAFLHISFHTKFLLALGLQFHLFLQLIVLLAPSLIV